MAVACVTGAPLADEPRDQGLGPGFVPVRRRVAAVCAGGVCIGPGAQAAHCFGAAHGQEAQTGEALLFGERL